MGDQDVLKMQQKKDFLIKFCYWAVIAVYIYSVFKYLLPVLFPFVLAYGIAYILAKPVRRIAGESRWKRAFFSIFYNCRGIGCLAGGMALFWSKADHRISSKGLSGFCLSVFRGWFCMDRGAVYIDRSFGDRASGGQF